MSSVSYTPPAPAVSDPVTYRVTSRRWIDFLIIGFMLYITSHDVRRWVRVWRLFHPPDKEAPREAGAKADAPAETARPENPASDSGAAEARETPPATPNKTAGDSEK